MLHTEERGCPAAAFRKRPRPASATAAALCLALALTGCASRPAPAIPEPEAEAPVVLEPRLTVRSVVLVRYELVNVLLELVLEVENPNAFPVEFSSGAYQFYGEGRKWAGGRTERAVPVPAMGSAEIRLPILLNFTETGRDLFDLVAQLKIVRYRLTGRALVTTPSSFLPAFEMAYDESGAVRVERTLPAGR